MEGCFFINKKNENKMKNINLFFKLAVVSSLILIPSIYAETLKEAKKEYANIERPILKQYEKEAAALSQQIKGFANTKGSGTTKTLSTEYKIEKKGPNNFALTESDGTIRTGSVKQLTSAVQKEYQINAQYISSHKVIVDPTTSEKMSALAWNVQTNTAPKGRNELNTNPKKYGTTTYTTFEEA